MAFLDSLRKNNQVLGTPAGGTFNNEMYYGQPSAISGGGGFGGDNDFTSMMNLARFNRLQDFEAKTRITGDEAIRQENYRRMYDPDRFSTGGGAPTQNVVYQPPASERDQVSPADRAKFDLAREQMAITRGNNKSDQELEAKKFELDKLKNEQIYGTKQNDMERKTAEANQKLQLAYNKLQLDAGNSQNIAAYRQAQIDATNARMQLQQTQHEAALTEQKRFHDAQMKDMQDKMDALQRGGTSETVWTDADGVQHKTTNSRKGTVPVKPGNTPGTVRVIAPDGTHGDWPSGKPLPNGYTHIGQ